MITNKERMDYDLDETERAVLDVIREEQRVNPLRIRERTDIRKQYVNDALRQLRKLGVVNKVNKGLYEYNPEADSLPGVSSVGVGDEQISRIKRALDDIEAAAERGDGDALREAIQRARKAIKRV